MLSKYKYQLILIRTAEQKFRYHDGSPADEDETLARYLQIVDTSNEKEQAQAPAPDDRQQQSPPSTPSVWKVYVAPLIDEAAMAENTENLLSRDFSIKILEWQVKESENVKSGGLTSRGTVLSKSLDTKTPIANLKLAALRIKLSSTSFL